MGVGPAIAMLALIALPTAAMASDDIPLARAPSDMSGDEIDAHNQGLASTDADYIRCRRIQETGSLVRKARVCNTNAQWKIIVDKGNQDARDSMETLARGWSNSKEPAEQLVPTGRPQ